MTEPVIKFKPVDSAEYLAGETPPDWADMTAEERQAAETALADKKKAKGWPLVSYD